MCVVCAEGAVAAGAIALTGWRLYGYRVIEFFINLRKTIRFNSLRNNGAF